MSNRIGNLRVTKNINNIWGIQNAAGRFASGLFSSRDEAREAAREANQGNPNLGYRPVLFKRTTTRG